jgi:three-Cys-motif partner protein
MPTLWPRGAHTEGKHLVLKRYLGAWFPIQGAYQAKILFIDGFAGPGEYTEGEYGSPLIALQTLIDHTYRDKIAAEVVYLFIEASRSRAEHLKALIQEKEDNGEIPRNCKVMVTCHTFEEAMCEILNGIDETGQRLAPAFVMVDPFGVKGMSMTMLARILQYEGTEIYATFHYDAINRFKGTPDFEPSLDALFGCQEWRQASTILDPEARRVFLYNLYREQLKNAGAKHVVYFELFEERRLKYAIFFATQHKRGCDKMKEAIWKVAPDGDYTFRGRTGPQLSLNLTSQDLGPLKAQLIERFKDQGWVSIETVQDYMCGDETPYYSGQLKTHTLKPMERDGLIEVDESTRRRTGTYPSGTRLRFIGDAAEA